jgi:hypothetical protein
LYADRVRVVRRAAGEPDLLDDEEPLRALQLGEEPLHVPVRPLHGEGHREGVGARLVDRPVPDRVGAQADAARRGVDLLDEGGDLLLALAERLREEGGEGGLGVEELPLRGDGLLGLAARLVAAALEAGLLLHEGAKALVVEGPVGEEDRRVRGEDDEEEGEEEAPVAEGAQRALHGFTSRSR